MENLQELILYENENTRLDFKRDEYRKENFPSFLKDVISMANAFTNEDRFIIIGLKPKSVEDRGFKGVKGQLTDSAIFQQLVNENIEPEILIEYFPYNLHEYQFGILKISNCDNPPYQMKKDYGSGNNKLYKGEGFIRKGTHQTRLIRADIDKYIQKKIDTKFFNDEVVFTFKTWNCTDEIELIEFDEIKRPSQIQKEKIQKILEKKRAEAKRLKNMGIQNPESFSFGNQFRGINSILSGGGIPYEDRDINTLEKNLENVEKTYLEDDYYEFFEKQTNKCNLVIFNKGDKYIEDATLILKIPKVDGLMVLDKIYTKPNGNSIVGNIEFPQIHYPEVKEEEEYYIIESSIGDIKHRLSTNAFGDDLRIFATTKMDEESLIITCELFAKNIKTSIKKKIEIKTIKKLLVTNCKLH